jgi:putative tryptophan/tyrosine transport system substrate-binding protein
VRSDECQVDEGREKHMKKTITVLTLCAMLFALCFPAEAQQPKKVPRIGFTANNPGTPVEAFRRGLRDLGYVEGKNILVEYRYIEGDRDRIPSLVAELLQLNVDILVATSPPTIRAAKQATKTIPIVIVTPQDPVATGAVDSLARPGGNITGLTTLTRELSGKSLELLKEVIPTISRVGVLAVAGPTVPGNALKEYEAAGRELKISIQPLLVRSPNPDIEGAFREAAKGRVTAVVAARNNVLSPHTKKIAELAMQNRLPSMLERSDYAEAGGLMSYGANDAEQFRRAAYYVDKILKGAKPAELPVEQPIKFEFIINLKTAKALNLTIPQSVLFRADRVIK